MKDSSERRFSRTPRENHFEAASHAAYCLLPDLMQGGLRSSLDNDLSASQEPRTVFELITVDGRIITQVQPK